MEIFIRGLVALGIALAVAAYGFSDTVKAPPAQNGAATATVNGDAGCGWAPRIQHLFHLGHGGSNSARTPLPPHTPAPRTQPGTVVFPQAPFSRSPRDFFMID